MKREWKYIKKYGIQWNIQCIPKKIPKRFRCRFPADNKKDIRSIEFSIE